MFEYNKKIKVVVWAALHWHLPRSSSQNKHKTS